MATKKSPVGKTKRHCSTGVRAHGESIAANRAAKERKPMGSIELGAYPIKHHLDCPERTRKDASYPEELQTATPAGLAARLTAGIEFEDVSVANMLEGFEAANWRRIDIDCGDKASGRGAKQLTVLQGMEGKQVRRKVVVNISMPTQESGNRSKAAKAQAEAVTCAAMAAGCHVIFGGRLRGAKRVGQPDILIRESFNILSADKMPSGKWTYLGGDFKDHKSFEGAAKPTPWLLSTLVEPSFESALEREYKGTPQLLDSLQLCHYWYLLDHVGRAGARVGGIVGRESLVVWRPLDDKLYRRRTTTAFEVYDEGFTGTIEAITHERSRMTDDSLTALSGPEKKASCGECHWRDVCKDELVSMGHITLLPGITPPRAQAHYAAGVTSIRQLAELDSVTARLIDEAVDVPGLMATAGLAGPGVSINAMFTGDALAKLTRHGLETSDDLVNLCETTAKYHGLKPWRLAQSIDQARVVRVDRVHRARGVEFVEIPRAAVELDIDIEDDAGGVCYLIGVKETNRARGERKERYIPFVTWEHSDAAEAQVFADFFNYVMEKIEWAKAAKVGSVRAFHYTDHESRYFKHLAEKHEGVEGVPTLAQVEAFLDSDVWVDMRPILAEQLIWPCEDQTLKSLAKYVKFFWRDEDPGGANSVAWYRDAVSNPDEQARLESQTRVLEYNEDDVEATYVLREWITRFGETRKPGVKLPGVEVLDKRFARRRARKSPFQLTLAVTS